MVSPLQPLERRRLFCVELVGGVINVVGSKAADAIAVRPLVIAPDEFVQVNHNGKVTNIPAEAVNSIVINGGAGPDDHQRRERSRHH